MKQWTQHFQIYDFFCKNQVCQLSYLFHMMLETSNSQSRALGSSTEDLMEKDLTWMIYKWKVDILRYPVALEEIDIHTWVSSFEKIHTTREFVIQKGEEILCRAQAVFIVVDLKKKKPIAIPNWIASCYPILLLKNFEKIERIGKGTHCISEMTLEILRNQIDLNNHVNNIVYADWILEALPEEYRRKGQPQTFNITYMREVTYPSQVKVCCFHQSDTSLIFEIQWEVLHARAQLEWKSH